MSKGKIKVSFGVDDIPMLIDLIEKQEQEIERLNNIIKEAIEEVRIYEVQSKDGITNELDNYVFVQRLKNVLNKGE